ncbi:hypothetical protein [Coleofasciculus sp. F4-SAH-05]
MLRLIVISVDAPDLLLYSKYCYWSLVICHSFSPSTLSPPSPCQPQ